MWRVTYKKTFLRELKKLPEDVRAKVEEFVFNLLPALTDLSDVSDLKKLIGYSDYYRVRFGEYRLGDKGFRVLPYLTSQGYISLFSLKLFAGNPWTGLYSRPWPFQKGHGLS